MLPSSIRVFPLLAALLGAAVFGILAAKESFGPRKAEFRFYASVLFASFFLWMSFTEIVELRKLPHFSAEGVVQNLHKTTGKHAHSIFNVVISGFSRVNALKMDYTGDNLQNGQNVHVDYVGVRGTVTRFQVFKGPDKGWIHKEGDGTLSACLIGALGLFLIGGAYNTRRKYPDGNVPGRYGRRPAQTSVDQDSMLHFTPGTRARYHDDRV